MQSHITNSQSTHTMKLSGSNVTIICIISIISRFQIITALGFSIDLIHRDFIQSPSLISSPQIVINALRRSFDALKQDNSPRADILSDKGEYLMKFSVGTPPVETYAVADTGSDLTWIQCSPCTNCFNQKAPLFEPTLSSTYKSVSCTPVSCNNILPTAYCDDTCRYTIGYGDSSFSKGRLATETITLGSVTVPNVIVGCGHDDRGTFGVGASGIVGLGGGKTSLINQIGPLAQGKFSYCLGSYVAYPSKMSFGDDADVSGDGVVTTAIITKSPRTFYYLTLEGISVGDQRIDYYTPSSSNGFKEREEGNIIIDSGTTLTFLPKELYNQVIAAVKGQMRTREIEDPERLLSLCYYSRGAEKFPEFIFHFKGADLKLKAGNIFVRTRRNCVCLGLAAASGEAIYGNLAQMDFLVGYDLENMRLSFKSEDCTKS